MNIIYSLNNICRYCQSSNLIREGSQGYELFAVTVHKGTLSGGHYIAYVKRQNKKWYLFNDEIYQEVSEQEVLDQEAYLMFYRRIGEK